MASPQSVRPGRYSWLMAHWVFVILGGNGIPGGNVPTGQTDGRNIINGYLSAVKGFLVERNLKRSNFAVLDEESHVNILKICDLSDFYEKRTKNIDPFSTIGNAPPTIRNPVKPRNPPSSEAILLFASFNNIIIEQCEIIRKSPAISGRIKRIPHRDAF
ncbi:hypothetical protein QTP88_028272 [Uroleucon formosanum]